MRFSSIGMKNYHAEFLNFDTMSNTKVIQFSRFTSNREYDTRLILKTEQQQSLIKSLKEIDNLINNHYLYLKNFTTVPEPDTGDNSD